MRSAAEEGWTRGKSGEAYDVRADLLAEELVVDNHDDRGAGLVVEWTEGWWYECG
jgi:hypothetical protein